MSTIIEPYASGWFKYFNFGWKYFLNYVILALLKLEQFKNILNQSFAKKYLKYILIH